MNSGCRAHIYIVAVGCEQTYVLVSFSLFHGSLQYARWIVPTSADFRSTIPCSRILCSNGDLKAGPF
uniref:Uncharacterized protein n=1 Tax=Anguilla anguilla TaxID=7936 RepID=A0A0E9X2F7_ANGAN